MADSISYTITFQLNIMTREYKGVYRTKNWITAMELGEAGGQRLVAVDTDVKGITWYYFQEIVG